jgi:hypothetical protein
MMQAVILEGAADHRQTQCLTDLGPPEPDRRHLFNIFGLSTPAHLPL